ncbi:MAG: acyl-CoA dehydrogenase C-terminal domain-containing protein [Alphaproteobacteria bacterium]|jgi:alkylation response protein AidB-like acyl-CoA dehydrogenase|nr:acyl-CoA dehydrogenase C-terminal domain-containing protein [Alphaproteobacteria bacterium]QQS57767.1 MAG: acyl-CoA dehydrogenase C-terminal domain-containing protein [Alphaproteobacteria bacterium]
MPSYRPPIDDIRFILHDVLKAESLSSLQGYQDFSQDLMNQIIGEGAKICEEVLFPLNQSGDAEGCILENGVVRTPKGFKDAYETFTQGGWCGLSADPEYGGMGMPMLLNTVMQEMICAANMSFGMYPGLSQGAYEALHHFGTDEQKALYLPKLISGEWSGTMCLTEPHCGTDLGLIKTKAQPQADGSCTIDGTKIFISAGEHDLAENIVHLVLAKLPDAPEGVKGISLFVVPKFLPKDDGSVGPRNGVSCGSIEHKMGIKASSTCVMNFDGAIGWLVGEPHKGLKAMFTMMNAARLGVAMQGLGIAEVAYQNAVIYAKDRLQMRSLKGAKNPEKPADPIIVHPDVRRMLLTGKAFVEGSRALSYWVGMNLDISHRHPDAQEKQRADDLVALLTPIVKAYQTDMGTEVAILAQQVYGGHGYIWEWGMEQYVRDARIAQIYEGTNGIQALDLVGRKMPLGYGRLLRRFFHPVQEFINAEQTNPKLQEFVFALAKAFAKLQQSTATIAQKGLKNPEEAGAASTDYLRQFALVALAYMWCLIVKTAQEKLEQGSADKAFLEAKLKTARFFMERMLPESEARFRMVMAGAATLMDMKESEF